MAEKEKDLNEDFLNVLEDIAEALQEGNKLHKKSGSEMRPVINVPQGPPPVINPPAITLRPSDVTVTAAEHPFASGVRVLVARDRYGNANEYRFLPL